MSENGPSTNYQFWSVFNPFWGFFGYAVLAFIFFSIGAVTGLFDIYGPTFPWSIFWFFISGICSVGGLVKLVKFFW